MKDDIDYDDLLSSAGEFGRYQIFLLISTFPFYLFGVFVYFTQPFITEVPNHWCWIPELENLTIAERKSFAIPADENSRFEYSRCQSYVANWTDVLATGIKPNASWVKTTCQHGWEYNKTEIPYSTISSEMEWVCEKQNLQNTALAIFYVGSVFGGLLMGWVADRFGRLPATILANLIGCAGGVLSAFARSFTVFSVGRFIVGMASDSCMMIMYLLVLEYVAPKYRSIIASLSFALFYAPSVTLLPWLALACGHWKTIALVTSLPLSLSIFTPLVIPESPRWLLSKGRVEEAIDKAVMISKVNKKEIPSVSIEKFRFSLSKDAKEENVSVLDLLKRPVMRRTFIYTCIVFSSCHLVFDGLVRSISQLDYNFFESFSIVSSTEFPSLLLNALVMDWMGRQCLTVTAMLVSAVFCVLTVSVGGGIQSVICAFVARFAANMAYGTVLQWSAEVIPTSVRGLGTSIVYTLSEILIIVTPYILYLEVYVHWLPFVVIAILSCICALSALGLPETAGKEMPQKFDDAEEIIKNKKIFEMVFRSNNKEGDESISTTPQSTKV